MPAARAEAVAPLDEQAGLAGAPGARPDGGGGARPCLAPGAQSVELGRAALLAEGGHLPSGVEQRARQGLVGALGDRQRAGAGAHDPAQRADLVEDLREAPRRGGGAPGVEAASDVAELSVEHLPRQQAQLRVRVGRGAQDGGDHPLRQAGLRQVRGPRVVAEGLLQRCEAVVEAGLGEAPLDGRGEAAPVRLGAAPGVLAIAVGEARQGGGDLVEPLAPRPGLQDVEGQRRVRPLMPPGLGARVHEPHGRSVARVARREGVHRLSKGRVPQVRAPPPRLDLLADPLVRQDLVEVLVPLHQEGHAGAEPEPALRRHHRLVEVPADRRVRRPRRVDELHRRRCDRRGLRWRRAWGPGEPFGDRAEPRLGASRVPRVDRDHLGHRWGLAPEQQHHAGLEALPRRGRHVAFGGDHHGVVPSRSGLQERQCGGLAPPVRTAHAAPPAKDGLDPTAQRAAPLGDRDRERRARGRRAQQGHRRRVGQVSPAERVGGLARIADNEQELHADHQARQRAGRGVVVLGQLELDGGRRQPGAQPVAQALRAIEVDHGVVGRRMQQAERVEQPAASAASDGPVEATRLARAQGRGERADDRLAVAVEPPRSPRRSGHSRRRDRRELGQRRRRPERGGPRLERRRLRPRRDRREPRGERVEASLAAPEPVYLPRLRQPVGVEHRPRRPLVPQPTLQPGHHAPPADLVAPTGVVDAAAERPKVRRQPLQGQVGVLVGDDEHRVVSWGLEPLPFDVQRPDHVRLGRLRGVDHREEDPPRGRRPVDLGVEAALPSVEQLRGTQALRESGLERRDERVRLGVHDDVDPRALRPQRVDEVDGLRYPRQVDARGVSSHSAGRSAGRV